ncbi:putative translation initiation factor eIF5 [Kockovaella imperatae]|uniref:Putative translation initiation factor eIF5 n=1 Tax=Kockovaella imperatae TaxID=4999 RepID=A0A1Y1UDC3_9TREE|nr:putative translation initiation factor eIF5 [Kockovaella imperatae]ORX36023.1 putative translation initiation factor eIF5 [Kockovaella imperatae]
MATVNIRRDVDDKFYRYKMPLLQTKIEGRGNGIKTVVPNMEDVARALNRPPTYPTKFFGYELGAQTSEANERYIVNGAHQADRLRELLDAFIDKFVLCPSCKNPETEIIISGKSGREDLTRDCKACGAQTPLDMRHKLITYIIKNPPKAKEKGTKKGKRGGMTAEANVGGPMVFDAATNGDDEDGPDTPPADNGVPTRGTDIDAALGRSDPILEDPDQAEVVSKKLSKLDVDDDDDDDADSPYSVLGAWLEDNKSAEDTEIIGKVKDLGIVGKHKVLVEVGHHLFTNSVATEVPKRTALLQVLCTSEKHQKSLLGGFERLLAYSPECDSLLSSGTTSKILMTLYQDDILDEEVVRNWGTHVSKKYVEKDKSKKVRKSAEAFLKWLDEADDESDDE